MGMHSLVYKGLHNISWYCDLCELPNFSSTLFDTTSFETTNRFDIFNDTPISEGVLPIVIHMPHLLEILVVL
jgi:hypothetical protein